MSDKPATRQSVADGRALYRVGKPPAAAATSSSGDRSDDTTPLLEALLDDRVLLGRTRARAARGDQAARTAIAAHDGAWRALNQTGGDDAA